MAGRIDGLPRSGDKQAAQALSSIQGERRAHDFLARLEAQKTDADELALIVSKLRGAELRGFTRILTRALAQQWARPV
jgi:hypothetical protein